jgi:hypothetical protein
VNRSNNNNKDLELFFELLNNLYNTAKKELQFTESVSIKMLDDASNSLNPLGKTASYNPATQEINLYYTGRHPKDLLRSFSHELVHHAQNCRGDFDDLSETNEGYAQDDSHLREMEREAYECGNMIFRDWEDGIKKAGVVPLFNNSPFATIQMGYKENLGDNKMSKKNLSESQLRDIIRGVIQEMFNDDLNEETIDNMNQVSMAKVALSQAADRAADDEGGQNVDDAVGTSAMEEGHDGDIEGTPLDNPEDPKDPERYMKGKVGGKVVEAEKLGEVSGEKEAWDDWKNEHEDDNHIEQMKHHLRALEDDRDHDEHEAEYDHDKYEDEGYDRQDETLEGEASLKESFLPKGRSIRANARQQTFDKLIQKWCK